MTANGKENTEHYPAVFDLQKRAAKPAPVYLVFYSVNHQGRQGQGNDELQYVLSADLQIPG